MAEGPLEGIRILDFTHVWAGPLATRILGDLGADVLKVEAPWARGPAGPRPPTDEEQYSEAYADDHWNRQGVTNKLNRNKRGLSLDSKSEQGHKILLNLVRECDVVIENFSAHAMKSMGLDWEVLHTANPRVIYVAMPGFGHSGPYRDYVAYGTVVEPMCGLTALMGYGPDEPRVTATAIPDPSAGLAAAAAVVTALQKRDEDNKGRYVELSLQEAAIALFGEYFLLEQMSGAPARNGNSDPACAPAAIYPCSGEDNWIAIHVGKDAHWLVLAELIGADWCQDEAFGTNANRLQNRQLLDEKLSVWSAAHDKHALTAQLQAAGIAAGAVQTTPDLLQDPQNVERGYFIELGNASTPDKPFPGLPVLIDGKRGNGYRAAPRLGEHNREILSDLLGMSNPEIEALEREGVLHSRPPE